MTGEERRNAAPGLRRLPSRIGSGRFPVRLKLAAVLFLPMVLLVVLATLRVLDVRQDAREARGEARLATAVTGPGSLLDVLVSERNHTAVYLMGAEDLFRAVEPGQYLETRKDVDAARQEFQDFMAGQNEQVQEIYAPALESLSQLPEVRDYVDADEGPQDFQNVEAVQDLFDRFDEVTGPLFDANQQVSLTVTDPALQRGTAIVDQSLRQSNTVVLLVYQLAVAALGGDADGVTTPDEYSTISMLLRDLRAGEEAIRLNAEGVYREHVEAVYASEHVQTFPELVAEAIDTGAPDVGGLFAGAEGDGESPGYNDLRTVAEEELEDAVDSMNGDARRTQAYFTILGLLVLALVGAVTTVVAWSITRPLRALTRQATTMANERLPGAVQGILEAPPGEDVEVPEVEPIEVRTRDEVADVTQALNTVQDSALVLAVEQAALRRNIADSFVNLGRRNQSLLSRLLDLITELEHKETEPDSLADLFRLDHLATRMRRNAESLLVLAGIDPPRRWTAPVRLTDVIRAALGEVEEYQRVTIRGVESAVVVGSAAPDLAHLLAELIENALTFSPPDHPVEVRGRYTPVLPSMTGLDQPTPEHGVYTLAIVDSGVGMSESAIDRANRRLAGEESFTVAPSKYLGHYVAGIVAARHGIDVHLRNSPQRGLTATLALPPGLLSSQETAGSPAPAPKTTVPGTSVAPAPAASRALEPPAGAAASSTTARAGDDGQLDGSRVSTGSAQLGGGPSSRQHAITDTYRVGDTEFHIDRGTSLPGLTAGDDASYAQLIHRVQGAQMPRTQPVSVPRTSLQPRADDHAPAGDPAGTGEWPDVPGAGPSPQLLDTGRGGGAGQDDERRARHVHSFLSSFSDGLEQGRDAAAREQEARGAEGYDGGGASGTTPDSPDGPGPDKRSDPGG